MEIHKNVINVEENILPKSYVIVKNEKENKSYVTTKEKGKYSCLEYKVLSNAFLEHS